MNSQSNIHFEVSKTSLLIAVLYFLLFIPVAPSPLYFVIFDTNESTTGKIVLSLFITLFFSLPLISYSIYSFIKYIKLCKNMKEQVTKYGKDNLIENIENHTISKYTDTYFTDKLIINPRNCIIDYNEISFMYKKELRFYKGIWIPHICFELYNGSKYVICRNINDEIITNYMQLCYQHNQKIMFAYNKENRAKHKDRVKQYKAGNIVIPQNTL